MKDLDKMDCFVYGVVTLNIMLIIIAFLIHLFR